VNSFVRQQCERKKGFHIKHFSFIGTKRVQILLILQNLLYSYQTSVSSLAVFLVFMSQLRCLMMVFFMGYMKNNCHNSVSYTSAPYKCITVRWAEKYNNTRWTLQCFGDKLSLPLKNCKLMVLNVVGCLILLLIYKMFYDGRAVLDLCSGEVITSQK
jgi:hypothetical protein